MTGPAARASKRDRDHLHRLRRLWFSYIPLFDRRLLKRRSLGWDASDREGMRTPLSSTALLMVTKHKNPGGRVPGLKYLISIATSSAPARRGRQDQTQRHRHNKPRRLELGRARQLRPDQRRRNV
jgi:hypothetical protein